MAIFWSTIRSNPFDVDLTNDHPVDIPWPTVDVGPGNNFDTVGNVTGGLTTYDTEGLPLYGTTNNLECSTCHNPHLQPTSTVGNGNFLRLATVTDNTSLCRVCHLSQR